MAFSSAGRSGPLADINVTPLVDVMLVLLIIFIVTAPIVARPIA
ncbi:ExbD/TolR family protein, partial [Stenotrophomonas muris]